MSKKIFTDESFATLIDTIKTYVESKIDIKLEAIIDDREFATRVEVNELSEQLNDINENKLNASALDNYYTKAQVDEIIRQYINEAILGGEW